MYDYQSMSYEERRAFVARAKRDAHRVRAEYVAAPFRAVYGFVVSSIRHAA